MAEWTLHGEPVRDQIETDLQPKRLVQEIREYQYYFGKDFGLSELLKVREIQAKGRIAEALCNMPEFLLDQIGKARNDCEFEAVSGEFKRLNDFLDDLLVD